MLPNKRAEFKENFHPLTRDLQVRFVRGEKQCPKTSAQAESTRSYSPLEYLLARLHTTFTLRPEACR
jgi:hypothetical protein